MSASGPSGPLVFYMVSSCLIDAITRDYRLGTMSISFLKGNRARCRNLLDEELGKGHHLLREGSERGEINVFSFLMILFLPKFMINVTTLILKL